MKRLKTTTTWIPSLFNLLKNLYHFHIIIHALNVIFLCQHYENINHNHNFQMCCIICLIETRIHHISTNVHKFVNSSKYSYISIHYDHGLMLMYDVHIHNTTTNAGSKYIIATLNANTRKQYILYVCK